MWHAPSLWGGECIRSVHRKAYSFMMRMSHMVPLLRRMHTPYIWRWKYPSSRSRVRNPYPWRGECVSRLYEDIRLPQLYVGDILSSCIDQWSLTSKLVVVGDPLCVSHEFVPPHVLATSSWIWWLPRRYFITHLHPFLVCEHRCWHVANTLVSYWTRWCPTKISMIVSRAQFVCFLCMFRQCKMRHRPDVHRLWIVAIFAKIESVQNRNLLL